MPLIYILIYSQSTLFILIQPQIVLVFFFFFLFHCDSYELVWKKTPLNLQMQSLKITRGTFLREILKRHWERAKTESNTLMTRNCIWTWLCVYEAEAIYRKQGPM